MTPGVTRTSTAGALRLAAAALLTTALAACGTTVETAGSGPGSLQPGGGLEAPAAPGAAPVDTAGGALAGGGSVTAGGTGVSAGTLGPGSADAGSLPGGSAGATAARSASGGRAAAVARGPISVGFVVADFTKTAAAFGFGAVSDPQRYFKYLVASFNARGGLAGRKIAPVYSSVDGSAADWSVASQAVCSAMTEDNRVELVVSNLWVHPTLTACLKQAGVPQIEGSATVSNDVESLAEFPNLFVPSGLATDRSLVTRINESVRLGWLTRKDKLGIVYDGCPHNVRAVKEAGVPTARRHGIPVEAFEGSDCGVGFSDTGKFTSGMQNAAFKLRSDGVTKVMFVTQGENGALVFFSNNAETQSWHPTYIVSSNAMMSSTESQGQINPGQRPYVRGIGWHSLYDDAKAPETPQMRDCKKHVVAGGGSVPSSVNDNLSMYSACNAITATAAALKASGGVGGLPALQAAIESLGTSFTSVTSIQGRTRFGPRRHDGAGAVAPFAYVKACDCFTYVGAPRNLS